MHHTNKQEHYDFLLSLSGREPEKQPSIDGFFSDCSTIETNKETYAADEYTDKLKRDTNTLIHCLFEEWTSQGNSFASPDTEMWFQQTFGGFSESTSEIFKRLINKNKGDK